jgi:acyl-homoserine-lactone acylase
MKRFASLAVAVLAVTAPAAGLAAGLDAQIVRTRYGIPHVTAADYASLGYGAGYAFAQDNVCLLADDIVTVTGERSKYFGPEGKTEVSFADVRNIDSDTVFHAVLDGPVIMAAFAKTSPEYRQSVRGYVAGYNRYPRETGPGGLPAACRGAPWVHAITVEEHLKLAAEKMIQAGAGAWLTSIAAAAPPSAPGGGTPAPARTSEAAPLAPDLGLGSNGWAFGRSATGGAGVLLGNPHFPWLTTNRFYQIHLTIPGKLDVMGAAASGQPGVAIGFNKDVAWTHTVSTDRHFTLFELTLDPADPTVYLVDGKPLKMEKRTITLEVKGSAPIQRTIWTSIYGPIVVRPLAGLVWNHQHAYALKDANRVNLRSGDMWLGIDRARSVAEIRRALDALGDPWVNTIATDRAGDVLYADITATPDLSAAKLADCVTKSSPIFATLSEQRLYVLNGSRSACHWTHDPASPVPGLIPPAAMPQTVRQDFVANSNDSYWLANDTAPLTGFSPIIGRTDEPQNLRTRAGLTYIHDQLAKGPRAITPAVVEAMIFADRNYAAETNLDDILAICAAHPSGANRAGAAVDLAPACAALARWDRRMNLDSRGAALFVEFWDALGRDASVFAIAFDAVDPVHTPRGIKHDESAAAKVTAALAEAVTRLAARGIALDARWGEVQVAVRGDQRIPIHGGPGADGVLDAQQSAWTPGVGYVPFHGSSYMQVVTFDARGPVADGLLSYSQSTDPASPFYADQTWAFSRKEWNHLPFWPADIAAQAISQEHISE